MTKEYFIVYMHINKVNNKKYNETDYFANVIFPAIYKFPNLKSSIRIELIEYTPNVTNTEFDNHIRLK